MTYNVGDTICNCTLLQKCGEGAYGEVWLARDAIGANVALKIIKNGGRYSERELAGLKNYKDCNHPNLLKIRYVEITDAQIICIMDAADDLNHGNGEYKPDTLANRLRKYGRLDGKEISAMLDGLLSGLEELHKHGLVHRDIKPDNILWVNGRATLADVGLIALEGAGSLVGTPGFLSPRVLEGNPAQASDDFYALGKVIYCALTGLAVSWLKVSLQGECSGKITYTGEQMSALRESISAFVFRHTGHGKQCIIDYVERDDMGEECFFVYYDKPHRIIPQWNENGFAWDVDHASSEMVFVFDYVRNELRIRAKAFDRSKRTLLCQTWADIMRGVSLDQSSFRSKLYEIDDFIYREKSHLPLELINVFSTFEVSFIDVDLDGSGKERLTYNHKDGDVYDRLDTLYSNTALVRGLAEVRKIKFRVRLNPRYKFNRDMVIYFSGDHTDLYSKNEAVRQTLADAFETLGIIQPPVINVINGGTNERIEVAV